MASLALMGVVTWPLARTASIDAVTVSFAVIAMALLFRYNLNSVWLVLGGAILGFGMWTLAMGRP